MAPQRYARTSLRALLSGGDRRSLARSAAALAIVRKDGKRVSELAALAADDEWLVSMRALDLLEKIAREHPDQVQPHRALFIGPLADADKWEVRLQIVRTLPLLEWTARQRARVVQILSRDVEHPQKFVRAWALDGLATLAEADPRLAPVVSRHLDEFDRSGSKALQSRARQIRARLGSSPGPSLRRAGTRPPRNRGRTRTPSTRRGASSRES